RRRDRSALRRGGPAGRQGADGLDLLPAAAHGSRVLPRRQAHRHDDPGRSAGAGEGVEASRGPRLGGLLRGSGPAASMNRSILLPVLSAPALAYLVFRLARQLGFLDPSRDLEHEYRRTIMVALYALLLFLSIFLFGWGRGWPRAWIIFGVVNGLALVVFAAVGT